MTNLDSVDKKLPILVVDDFDTMRRILTNALITLGFENITTASNGEEALSKLKEGDFKFVISDWNMPKMMGLDLLRAVRADEKLSAVPFLMVTAESLTNSQDEQAREEIQDYIVKPFTVDHLEKKMETLLEADDK